MIEELCEQAKQSSLSISLLSAEQKNTALRVMAQCLQDNAEAILKTNQQDVQTAQENKATPAFIDRLSLGDKGVQAMVDGLLAIAELPEPIGKTLAEWTVPSGLHIKRVSVPLGVILVIYEARPNVTADAAALCLKSGNAVILRGGSECAATNLKIAECLRQGLQQCDLDPNMIQYVPSQDRTLIDELLTMDKYIDVVVPRGGRSLIERISTQSRIPVFRHLDGICHTYVHAEADPEMAIAIVHNAKLRRTGICGATETLLIDEQIAPSLLPKIVADLTQVNCEVRGDATSVALDDRIKLATEADWGTEYLDAIISVKIVANVAEAISHINYFGSYHTEAIITSNDKAATQFTQEVNSAIVMHNTSTQFADGGEFGMGAEIGIATGKLHARGPVGIEQLTTFKYVVEGAGQTRA